MDPCSDLNQITMDDTIRPGGTCIGSMKTDTGFSPMNIPGERQEIAILLAQAGVVAPFESGPSCAWQAVIPLGVSASDGAHGAAKIPVRGLKEEMVMMAH